MKLYPIFNLVVVLVSLSACTQQGRVTSSSTQQVSPNSSSNSNNNTNPQPAPTINGGSAGSGSNITIENLPSGTTQPQSPSSQSAQIFDFKVMPLKLIGLVLNGVLPSAEAQTTYTVRFYSSQDIHTQLNAVLGGNYASLASDYASYVANPSAGVPTSLNQSLSFTFTNGPSNYTLTKPLSVWMNPDIAAIVKGVIVYLGSELVPGASTQAAVKLSAITNAKFINISSNSIRVLGGVDSSGANRRNSLISLNSSTQSFSITTSPNLLPSTTGLVKYVVKSVDANLNTLSSSFGSTDVGTKIVLAHANSSNKLGSFTVIDTLGNLATPAVAVVCAEVISAFGSPYSCPIVLNNPNTTILNNPSSPTSN